MTFIDINNRKDIFNKLSKLKTDTQPVFGIMSSQNMLEHLAFVVNFSHRKNAQSLMVADEIAVKSKHFVINTENELPQGIKFPSIGNQLPMLKSKNLNEALAKLKNELIEFDKYFIKNKRTKTIHPVLGALTYQEWIIFHNKHFTHHFKQFNLF